MGLIVVIILAPVALYYGVDLWWAFIQEVEKLFPEHWERADLAKRRKEWRESFWKY